MSTGILGFRLKVKSRHSSTQIDMGDSDEQESECTIEVSSQEEGIALIAHSDETPVFTYLSSLPSMQIITHLLDRMSTYVADVTPERFSHIPQKPMWDHRQGTIIVQEETTRSVEATVSGGISNPETEEITLRFEGGEQVYLLSGPSVLFFMLISAIDYHCENPDERDGDPQAAEEQEIEEEEDIPDAPAKPPKVHLETSEP